MNYRQIHLDFHTAAVLPLIGCDFDAEDFAQTLKDAHVNSINIFAKCHHGMCYYPTKVGVQHPNLKFDLLGAMIQALHKNGIQCPIYIPIGWEEEAATRTQWLEINKDGLVGNKPPFDTSYHGWKKLCLNNEEYKAYVFTQVREIMENYEVDGLWFDIVTQFRCLCPTCLAEMREMGLDPQNEKDVKKHDEYVLTKLQTELNALIRSIKDVPMFYNSPWMPDDGGAVSMNPRSLLQMHMELESLPGGDWGYHHFPLLVNYYNRNNGPVIGMTGKFHLSWGDHGTLKNQEALEFECFRMIANGAACSIGDQLHPRGAMNKAAYARIGKVYSEVEKVEPWCKDTSKVADIGVLIPTDFYTKDTSSAEGVVRMLNELHYTFDFVDRADAFDRYKLLLLPDSAMWDDDLRNKVKTYLATGGKVLATGKSADAALGIEVEKENPYCPAYICVEENFDARIAPLEYVIYEKGVLVKTALPTLADVGKPYFNRTYDCFSSHRHFPFDEKMPYPAVVCSENIGYCAFPLFEDYRTYANHFCRDIIQVLFEKLLSNPCVRVAAPSSLEMTMRKKENKTMVHLLHYIPERRAKAIDVVDTKLPLYNIPVEICCANAKRVYCVRSGEELEFVLKDGYVSVCVPQINGYEILCVEEA